MKEIIHTKNSVSYQCEICGQEYTNDALGERDAQKECRRCEKSHGRFAVGDVVCYTVGYTSSEHGNSYHSTMDVKGKILKRKNGYVCLEDVDEEFPETQWMHEKELFQNADKQITVKERQHDERGVLGEFRGSDSWSG